MSDADYLATLVLPAMSPDLAAGMVKAVADRPPSRLRTFGSRRLITVSELNPVPASWPRLGHAATLNSLASPDGPDLGLQGGARG